MSEAVRDDKLEYVAPIEQDAADLSGFDDGWSGGDDNRDVADQYAQQKICDRDPGDRDPRPNLERLIRETPALWRGRSDGGGRSVRPGEHTIDTGFADLNRLLPNGGWPLRAIIEINVSAWGNGELQLFMPLLARLTQGQGRVAMVAPPYRPYAPALMQGGVALPWLMIVDCCENTARNVWWSAEKLLRHPDCGVVLLWPPQPDPAQVRRLQLAADASDSIGVVFHCGRQVDTPVGLRLFVSRGACGVEVRLDKSRYGWRQQGQVVLPETALS